MTTRTRTRTRRRLALGGTALAVAAMLSQFAATGVHAAEYVPPPRLCEPGPGDRPEPGVNGHIPRSAMYDAATNPDGFQGYWCGVRKVAQHSLFNRGAFGDLQIKGRCAYASNRDGAAGGDAALTSGIIVFDVSQPSIMKVVPASGDTVIVGTAPSASVTTSTNKWGEQTTAAVPVNPNGKILRTPAALEAYSGLELAGNIMVAGYKDRMMVDVYDVSDCLNPVPLNASYQAQGGHHDGWLTHDGKTWYGVPFGTTVTGGGGPKLVTGGLSPTDRNWANYTINTNRVDLHVTSLDDPRNPQPLLIWNRSMLPEEVKNNENWRIMAATNIHDVSSNPAGTRIYLSVYGGGGQVAGNIPTATTTFWNDQTCSNGLLILDSSDVKNRVANPQLRYISYLSWCDQQPDPDFEQGGYERMTSTSATHATEWVRHVNGKEYILSTDESYALSTSNTNGIPTQCRQQSFGRMIDISDERNPRIVGTYKQDANKKDVCPELVPLGGNVPMIHYLNIDDRENFRVAAYASASGGTRFADWTDPTSPKEIAYHVKERHTATVMDFTRPDPRYDADNCLWYTGWNQGGLVSIELTNPQYNNCMRRRASGSAQLNGLKGSKAQVALDVQLGAKAPVGTVRLSEPGVDVRVTSFTRVGSAIDACGPVKAESNSVQMDGTGTFNGQPASFRVCVQDTGDGTRVAVPDRFYLTCTSGCSYTASGPVASGNLIVRQQ